MYIYKTCIVGFSASWPHISIVGRMPLKSSSAEFHFMLVFVSPARSLAGYAPNSAILIPLDAVVYEELVAGLKGGGSLHLIGRLPRHLTLAERDAVPAMGDDLCPPVSMPDRASHVTGLSSKSLNLKLVIFTIVETRPVGPWHCSRRALSRTPGMLARFIPLRTPWPGPTPTPGMRVIKSQGSDAGASIEGGFGCFAC